jgi:O-antigen/teichoic acid export membrane protein
MNARAGALRQVLTLLGGAGLAQAIALAASPALSRLYRPEHFGVFALFASVVALVSTAATGRYELAVILPSRDDEAWRVARLALAIALPVGLASAIVVAGAGEAIAVRAGDASLAPWLWLLPGGVVLTAAVNTLTVWANRRQAYRHIATNRVAQSVVTAGSGIGLGAAGTGSPGLIVASVLGQGVAAVLLWRDRGTTPAEGGATLRALAARYRDFPRINLPHALLDAVQASVVLALIGAAHGAAVLGAYAFALRIARAPLAMLGASVAQVFQQRAARLAETDGGHGELAALARSTTQRLALTGLPFAAVLLFAPDLFAWAFGADWRSAGEIARILLPWMLMNFVTSPLSQLPLIVGRQPTAFAFGVAYQATMVVPYVLGAALGWPAMTSFGVQSAAASALLVVYGAWLHRLAGQAR